MASDCFARWYLSMSLSWFIQPASSTPFATPRVIAWVISSGSDTFMVIDWMNRPNSSSTRGRTISVSWPESSVWRPCRSMAPSPVCMIMSLKA